MRRPFAPVLMLAAASSALAQTFPAPQPDDLLTGPTTRPALQVIQVVPLQNRATVNPVDPKNRPPTLKREGSFAVDRTGRVERTGDGGGWQFVFDAQSGLPPDTPMTLQPDLALMMVEDQLRLAGRPLHFRATGQVQEYLGRNYLLLQKIVVIPDDPTTAPATQPAAASQPATAPSTQSTDPNDVLDRMLQAGNDKRPPMQAAQGEMPTNLATTRPVDPRARPAVLRREGSTVVNRTGRVTRTPDGKSFEITFVADMGASMQDPSMVILPDLALMLMQDQVRLGGADPKFRVTGTVTEYHGRNYLLLQKSVSEND